MKTQFFPDPLARLDRVARSGRRLLLTVAAGVAFVGVASAAVPLPELDARFESAAARTQGDELVVTTGAVSLEIANPADILFAEWKTK